MVDRRIRDELLHDIRALSENSTVAYLVLIQPHHGNETAKGSIVVNAYEVFLEHNLGVAWPVQQIRELWLRSVDLIPDATVRDGEPDAGFKEWLWSQTQRRWNACHEIGYAINPYQMWQSVLVTGCAGEQVVRSNPLRATPIEISRIAAYAAEIAGTAATCEAEAVQCRQAAEESCRVRDAMSSQSDSPEAWIAKGKATIALMNYRKAEMKRVRLRCLADVVACYELALIPQVHLTRPGSDMQTPEGTSHFRRVSIELTNYANAKATAASDEPPKPIEARGVERMADTQSVRYRMQDDMRFGEHKREMARLDTDLQVLKSSNPIHEPLKTAYGYWGTYPLQRELLVDSPRREATDEHVVSETYLVLLKLDEVHKAAVDVLMSRSQEQGGNPTLIWKSANYCRELLADYQKTHKAYPANRESDYWPECLGPTLFELPADIRQAIQDGNAEVRTLCVPPGLLIDGLPKPAHEEQPEVKGEPSKPGETLPSADGGGRADVVGQGADSKFEFRPVGEDDYFIRGFGEEGQVSASRAIGLHDLYRVVQTPGVGVPMRELDAGPGVTQANGDEQSCQPAFDGETRKQLAAKRSQLKNDIESAESDMERQESQEELDKLESSAKAMTGLSGKPRDLNNPLNNLRPKFLGRMATVIALERFHPRSLQITASLEQVQAGLRGHRLLDLSDGFHQGLEAAFGELAEVRLQRREGHLDRVEVGRVRGQETHAGTDAAD